MIYIIKINDKEYEVEVERGKANIIKTTEGVSYNKPAPVITSEPVHAQATVSASGEIIKSPMPGTILDIKVSQGIRVKKGGILLILEAMKMENEILAPYDCVVAQVFTSKGASVATNDILISIN